MRSSSPPHRCSRPRTACSTSPTVNVRDTTKTGSRSPRGAAWRSSDTSRSAPRRTSHRSDCPPRRRHLLPAGGRPVMVAARLGRRPEGDVDRSDDIGTSPVLERLAWAGIADVAAGTPIVLPRSRGRWHRRHRRPVRAHRRPTDPVTALDVRRDAAPTPAAIGMLEAKLLDASDHTAGGGTILMSPIAAATAGGDSARTRPSGHPCHRDARRRRQHRPVKWSSV